MSHRGSTRSTRSSPSSGSGHSRGGAESSSSDDGHEDLLERAIAASSSRSRRSQRSSASQRSSVHLHDLEVMQAVESLSSNDNSVVLAARSSSESSPDEVEPTRRTTSLAGLTSSSAHLRYVLEQDASSGGNDEASAYSEYSEYEEDEFDPEWHARQNQQAALNLLNKNSGHPGSPPRGGAEGTTTERTKSVTTASDIGSEATGASSSSRTLFDSRPDLRQVDQSVNLMDASRENYDDPRGESQRKPRKGRKQEAGFFSAALNNSLVDVFLDTSDSKMPSFRRTLSRGNNDSLRRQAQAAPLHQRRLFYGHSPPPPPTIRERTRYCSVENCCKVLILLFVVIFVVILALPQGTWWIQEQLGFVHDGDGTTAPQSLPTELPTIPPQEARLESLRNMILTHELTSNEVLLDSATPQYQASLWLAHEDPAQLTLVLSDDSDNAIIEPHQVLNRYAMATFYIAMNGPKRDEETEHFLWNETSNWHANDDWMSEKHICDWYGIECEGRNHIEHFNMTRNKLLGVIPSELSILTNLILVDWSDNKVSGSFPEWMGTAWLDLEYLYLDKNEFLGTLPASIGNMTHLQELVLTHTNLKGTIPTEIDKLNQLRVLKMDHNQLEGSIPPLGGLTASLEYLTFYGNLLTGLVPEEIFHLTNLVELLLDHNSLKGTISSGIGAMHKLEALTISNNQFTGSLPDIWTDTPRLIELEVDNNHMRGILPSSIGLLTDLEYLMLDDNPFTGTIPSEIGHLENLVVFEAHHTELVGSMPEEVCSLKERRGIDLIVFGDCEDDRFQCLCCDRCY